MSNRQNYLYRYYWDTLRVPDTPSRASFWGLDYFPSPPDITTNRLKNQFAYLAGDEFPPLRDWPVLWREMFLRRKDQRERFRFFVFLWQNGMPPHHAVFWTMWHDSYDKPAWDSIMHTANSTLTAKGREAIWKNRVYLFHLGRVPIM